MTAPVSLNMAGVVAASLSETCAKLAADIAIIKVMERHQVGFSHSYRTEAFEALDAIREDLTRIETALLASTREAAEAATPTMKAA